MAPEPVRKKICTPRAACSSVRFSGSLGFGASPAVAVKVPASRLTSTVETMALPDVGVSGVTAYAYSATEKTSVYSYGVVGPRSKP